MIDNKYLMWVLFVAFTTIMFKEKSFMILLIVLIFLGYLLNKGDEE